MATISKHDSLNTQLNVINSLCKFLERTMATHYSNVILIRDQISLDLKKQNAEIAFPYILDILQKITKITEKKVDEATEELERGNG